MKICMRCTASFHEAGQARYGLCDACMAAVYAVAGNVEENASNSTWTALRLLAVRGDINSWTPEQIHEEYERRRKVVLSRFRAQAERAKAREDGEEVDAVFWHRGRVYHGTAKRNADGTTWDFNGAQDRTFVGRKAAVLTVAGMVNFNPRYRGKHTVEKTGGVAVVE